MEGDHRTLYLTWLRAAELYGDDDVREPPVPPGLAELPPEKATALLPPAERDAFLVRLMQREPHLALALHRRLQALIGVQPSPSAASRRTWGELWSRAEDLRREAERRAAAEAAARRLAELQALAPREHEVWHEVSVLLKFFAPCAGR